MRSYRPVTTSPGILSPMLGQTVFRPPVVSYALGQPKRSPILGQTFDEFLGMPAFCGDLIRLIFHGGTTFLGIHVGLREGTSFIGILGWILGIGNGLGAIADTISLIKRATGTHPVK